MRALPLEERDGRWQRIRRSMEARGLDCLVVWGCYGRFRHFNASLAYLSGESIEGYILFPLDGDPTVFTFMGSPTAWVRDGRGGHPNYSKWIAERLAELRLDRGRIGIAELSGYEGETGFPHSTYAALAGTLPEARLEDATNLLLNARMVKSPAEIECIEVACAKAEKVVQAVREMLRPGVRQYEVRLAMTDALFREGCEADSMILLHSGRRILHGGQAGTVAVANPVVLEEGDVVHTEFDARYLGYVAQLNQPFSLGRPSDEWQRVFDIAAEMFHSAVNTLRPGITLGEFEDSFLPPLRRSGYLSPRNPFFHGLGLALEAPVSVFGSQPGHSPERDRPILPGMVFEVEPPVVSPDFQRGTTIGCPVLVTETGCRLLTREWKPEAVVV